MKIVEDFYQGGSSPVITQDQSGFSRKKLALKMDTEAGSLACVARNRNIQTRESLVQE